MSFYILKIANCDVCTKSITSKQLNLVCNDCSKEFHGTCMRMNKADLDWITADGLTWRCQECSETRRKSLRFDSAAQEGKLSLEDMMKKIEEIAEGQKTQDKKSYEFLTEKIEENTETMQQQNLSMEKCLKMIDELMQENKSLNKKVADLEQRIDDMEQYSRANAIDIQEIPVQPNEDVISVVKEVGKALDLTVTDSMSDACHRLGSKVGHSGPPPGIIVKFVRRMDKEEFMRKRRVKRNLSTRHRNMPMDQMLYVNEALTPARRRLLGAARQIKREKNFKHLWVRGSKIFLRKGDGTNAIQVHRLYFNETSKITPELPKRGNSSTIHNEEKVTQAWNKLKINALSKAIAIVPDVGPCTIGPKSLSVSNSDCDKSDAGDIDKPGDIDLSEAITSTPLKSKNLNMKPKMKARFGTLEEKNDSYSFDISEIPPAENYSCDEYKEVEALRKLCLFKIEAQVERCVQRKKNDILKAWHEYDEKTKEKLSAYKIELDKERLLRIQQHNIEVRRLMMESKANAQLKVRELEQSKSDHEKVKNCRNKREDQIN
ncbi:uncharacterized protein LOC124367765 isoform X2 [Homalodisca vitripennis]|uniref:uncharacterized protein LOC124367765 isoform X2 n=1 Tax=Homalodisca vitripennis TaxID=197043 RepID=UPI001EEBBAB1|nr:uncharacterized protein LOC124367765 isoform X2 [Homalodisca vitripennis]